jgi:hypothetical protein
VSDLGVEDLEVALQVVNVPLDGVAVAGEQVEPVGDAGTAFATELGESLHVGDGHAGRAQAQQKRCQSRSVVKYRRCPPEDRSTASMRPAFS